MSGFSWFIHVFSSCWGTKGTKKSRYVLPKILESAGQIVTSCQIFKLYLSYPIQHVMQRENDEQPFSLKLQILFMNKPSV